MNEKVTQSACYKVVEPYDKKRGAAILVTGRSLSDIDINPYDGSLTTLMECLRLVGRTEFGLFQIRFSLGSSISFDLSDLDKEDRETVSRFIRNHIDLDGLKTLTPDDQAILILQGLNRMVNETKSQQYTWLQGKPLKIMLVFEVSEDMVPSSANGLTLSQIVASELSFFLSQSFSLRNSGHYVIFTQVDGEIRSFVKNNLEEVNLPFPNVSEKCKFIDAASKRYPNATFEIDKSEIANLSSRTPNRSVEKLMRSSDYEKIVIPTKQIILEKSKDVESISEGTLTLVDTSRIKGVVLEGSTIELPMQIMKRNIDNIRSGKKIANSNFIFAGGAGSGKTDGALILAAYSNLVALEMQSPKGGVVGETERKARKQQHAIREFSPCFTTIDEVTEKFPTQRNDFDGDNGASKAVIGEFLSGLSDSSRKNIIVMTTNCLWRIGEALLSRVQVIPVLMPTLTDFPAIICSIVKSIDPNKILSKEDPNLQNAARIFYYKNCSPRIIRSSILNSLSIRDTLNSELILFAAEDANQVDYRDRVSSIYADLYAIRLTSSKSFLPWYNNPSFHFPEYIERILDENRDVDTEKLNAELDRLKPFVNI